MLSFLSAGSVLLQSGFIFSILAMGYYVTYTILDFPDLTVEGTFLSGATTYGLLAMNGVNAWIGLLAAFVVGGLFGCVTGLLNVKLKIRGLLCGILVSTALISVNLVAVSAGMTGDFKGEGASTINYGRGGAIISNIFPMKYIPSIISGVAVRNLVMFFVIALVFKILLDLFFKTKSGLLIRAAGDNPVFVTTLARDSGNSKILGLAIGNGYAAVAGALYTDLTSNVNQGMGLGMIVIGLASLIIGLSVFFKVHFMKDTTKVILGAVIYQACLTLAQRLGVPSAYNKIIMALLFTAALIFSERLKKKQGGRKNA